jgi:glycosyltransferase involved in cell wall biosynthesis
LSLADVFVLPSLWEGTSLALLEAMAAGKPIVATDIPGNMAVLGPENGGLLVPPGDSAALADAICYMLNDGKAAGEYGKRADRIAKERFDVRKSIAQLELLWVPKVTVPFVPQTECARTLTHFR